MSITYTANAALQKPAANDRNWDTSVNFNTDCIDQITAVGALCVTTAESPSASLNVKVSAGTYRKGDGTAGTYAGTASQAMTASSTNYLYLTDSGTLSVNTTGFPAATNVVALATVVAGLTTITSVADARRPFSSFGAAFPTAYLALAGGTFADGSGVVTVGLGTTNGTKLGSGVTDKLGFYGVTPAVQPSGASQAALSAATAATLTDSTTGTASGTIGDVGSSFSQTTLNNIHASLASQINKLIADQAAHRTLSGAVRSALVALGLIKGSA